MKEGNEPGNHGNEIIVMVTGLLVIVTGTETNNSLTQECVTQNQFITVCEPVCFHIIHTLQFASTSFQVRIQDLVKGGAPASEAESCRRSEAESCERSEHSAAGVQGPLKGPGSFWVFDAQICILTHSRHSFSLIFDIYFDTKS